MPGLRSVLLPLLALLTPCLDGSLAAQGFTMGSYGSSCPGRGTPQTCAILDANGLTLFLHGANSRHAAVLIFGTSRAATSMGGGCTLWVRPALTIAAIADSQGRIDWRLPSPLQPDRGWRGKQLVFTHLVSDANGRALGGGFVLTNGFELRFL